MAKTASQIQAERLAIKNARDAIHQKQMEEVGPQSAAKTAAVLEAAGYKTVTNPETYEVSIAGPVTPKTRTEAPRTNTEKNRLDFQYKKESRAEERQKANAAASKRYSAQKAYDDYINSAEYGKKRAEREKQYQIDRAAAFAIDGFTPKMADDPKEMQLRAARDQAEAEYNAAEDQKVVEQDLEAITGLSNAERQQLEQYAVNQIRDQNLPIEMIGVMPTARQEASNFIDKYGQKRADEMAETFMRQENAKFAQDVDAKSREFVNKPGIIGALTGAVGSAATIPVAAVSGLVGTVGQLQGMARNTGRYKTLDPNATGTIGDTFTGAVRGQVGQNISDLLGGGIAGQIGSGVYQGVMSAADSIARGFLGGGAFGGAALAATGSFSQTMADASRRGATPAQAALLATTTAGIEALSEKIPLDNLIRTAKGQGAKTVIANALRQMGIEATTEEISLLGTVLAEAAILQEKSTYQQDVLAAIGGGATPEEAILQASRNVLSEALNTLLVSAVSGGVSSLGGSYADARGIPVPPTSDEIIEGARSVIDRQQERITAATQAAQQLQIEAQQVQETQQPQTAEQAPQQTPQPQTQQNEATQTAQNIPETEPMQATEASEQATTQASAPTTDMQMGANNQSAEGGQRDYRNSNTFMNTGLRSENENIRTGYRQDLKSDPDAAKYAVKHNADSLAEAKRRVATPESANAALDDLLSRDNWTAEDVATSTLLLDQIMESGDRNAIAKLADLRQARKNVGVAAGQVSQSFSIQNETMRDAASPATAVDTFRSNLDSMKESETTYSKKSGVDFETWKENIKTEVDNIGIAIATVEDGDSASMREIIKQIAKARKTTAWFGTTDRVTNTAWNVLKKLEFDDLKKIANTQVAAMADDYRRRSSGEVVGTIRKQNMLSSLKTFNRNIGGNAAGGIADAVSESGAGQMVDFLLSKVTGKRTVGNDLFRGKTYLNAAKEAGQFASLCVELNIPIETDVDSSFASAAGKNSNEKYVGKTFRATGNPAMRALYAYQKYMSYALEVTDKVFEGGSNAAVTESLNRLKNANLTDEEVQSLSQFASNKRTFKNATWEQEGKTKGSTLARKGTQLKNATGVVGEVVAPFVNVPMNVAQTGIDYTAGIAKSVYEIASIIKDAKAGKTIPVERQRQAASDFGRGVTGTAMIAMFASAAAMGALKASNDEDWDKEALAQAEGRSGAQINWDALQRGLNGESAEWKSGDTVTSLDFLEPFNTQMYLGYEIANTKDMNALKYAGATIKSVWESLMDSPVMTGLTDIEDTINDLQEAETPEDVANVAAGYAGGVATSFIPQYVRQTAQEMDGYYRDTRGATPIESAMNSVKAALPGLSQTLPKKYSGLGDVQERGSAFETFLDPTATREYKKNEVTGYLDELTERTNDDTVYPDRQAPMRLEVGGKEVQLDGNMRETYQKTYGEKVDEFYSGLIANKDFTNLPDDLKTEAFIEAKEYATRFAKGAVSDYRDIPVESSSQIVKNIVSSKVLSNVVSWFTDIKTDWNYGYDDSETRQGMEEAYEVYDNLSQEGKKAVNDSASGDAAKYLEVRDKGVTTDHYLAALKRIESLKPQPGYVEVRDIQEREAIADLPGVSNSVKDILMKAYMTDYDPNGRTVYKTELKYDYARKELGLTPSQYVDTYSVSLDGGKKKNKLALWMAMGYSRKEADMLYRLYDATGKTKIDVVSWHNGQ